ncbi:hypothetical protein GCM10010448_55490 [Streptomyces glomeratus]|uniref:Uncharacterized protein n=1 Tax=Streptomyces glomeratus TaxID=284452 RepID=A0ABP6M287_9ACTN
MNETETETAETYLRSGVPGPSQVGGIADPAVIYPDANEGLGAPWAAAASRSGRRDVSLDCPGRPSTGLGLRR